MPVKLSDSEAEIQSSPLLGEHTEEILLDVLGLSKEEVKAAWNSGALGEWAAKTID